MADKSSFKKTTFISIITHIEPYILAQPLKMSSVLLLPPIPKARGAIMVRVARTTYRSAISKKKRMIWKMRISPTMTTKSQVLSPEPKLLSVGVLMVMVLGIPTRSITLPVRVKPMLQIWRLAISRKEKTKVRVNKICGSSPSKPKPEAIARIA